MSKKKQDTMYVYLPMSELHTEILRAYIENAKEDGFKELTLIFESKKGKVELEVKVK